MPTSDTVITILFLIFLMIFVVIGNSPAVQRWLNRVFGEAGRENKAAPEEEPEEAAGGMRRPAKDYEAIVFQQLALAGEKGLSPANLADHLHFDRPMIEKVLASLKRKGMIRHSGLLGRRFRLSRKGREHAVQEGIIPRLRSGPGG